MSAVVPGVLADSDLSRVIERFGVSADQVRRDHLISHVLAAVAAVPGFVFLGGTALTRTVLPDLRLSEDIDLIAPDPRGEAAQALEVSIDRALARSFGEVAWAPRPSETRHPHTAVLLVAERLSVQVQVLDPVGYPAWPTTLRRVDQRYADAPSARLRVLTEAAFAASKLDAWLNRRAARDLYDLWALARSGHITPEAADLVTSLTSWTTLPSRAEWGSAPEERQWQLDLGHQTRLTVSAAEAFETVAAAWEELRRSPRT